MISDKILDTVLTPLVEGLDAILSGDTECPPWVKAWKDDGTQCPIRLMSRNGVSKRPYSGINWLILTLLNRYESLDWFTANQLKKITDSDKPIPYDEMTRGTRVVFFKMAAKKNNPDEMFPVMKTYTVWNHDQIPGLPESVPTEVADFDAATEVEKYLEGLNLKGGIHRGGDRAFFSPAEDAVAFPNDDAFECEHERESTKAHEGIHATGAKHRLNRKAFREYSKENYAYEELVAELGAAMTCAHLGIPLEKLQHTQYIRSWLKSLKDDKKFLFKAAADASKGFQLLTGVQ
jgi:antirestriction protein ArdC